MRSYAQNADVPRKRVRFALSGICRFFESVLFWFCVTLAGLSFIVLVDILDTPVSRDVRWQHLYPLLSGFLISATASFLFYYLVVAMPERRKRRIIKRNFSAIYDQIKRDIAYQIVFASKRGGRVDLRADMDTIERLLTVDGFRALFEGGHAADEGWYAFENAIGPDTDEYREIVLSLQMLYRQVDYLLHNYSFHDEEIFNFFKRLQQVLFRVENTIPDYDGVKRLSAFLWSMFGGWSMSAGYVDGDIVERVIDEI